jgi:uncharacterized RDD family membrane protein YckC
MGSHDEHNHHDEHREITIETLSSPPVQVKPAPLTRRITAGVIDSVILLLAWAFVRLALGEGLAGLWNSPPDMSITTYLVVLTFVYYFVMEGLFAATLGKITLKIRVLGSDGDPCSFGAAFIRNIIRFIDWLPLLYALGGLSVLASSKRQRLGDRIAKTVVSPAPEKDVNPPPAPFLFH